MRLEGELASQIEESTKQMYWNGIIICKQETLKVNGISTISDKSKQLLFHFVAEC